MRQKKSLKLKLRDVLKNNLVISMLIFIVVSLAAVLAGNVVVREGDVGIEKNLNVSGNLTTTGKGTFGSTRWATLGNAVLSAGSFQDVYCQPTSTTPSL